jgi:hypothetical protein
VCTVHLDYDAHDIRLELRSANVDHAAASLPVIARLHYENGASQIDHDSVRRLEHEVIDLYRCIDTDHDLGPAGCRNNTH